MSSLVILHKQLGDTVLLEPVLRKLACAAGEEVSLLCPRQFDPLIELMSHTRRATGGKRWWPERLWAYDWGGSTTRAAAMTFCKEKHLLLPPSRDCVTKAHRFVFHSIHEEWYLDRYLARYFWEQTPVSADAGVYAPPHLEKPPEEWRPKEWWDEPYLLLNPVSAWKRKSYDPQKWGIVLAEIRELGFSGVVMTGGLDAWQREHCEEIEAAASAHGLQVNNISGATSLRQFLHVISRAALVLCIDGAASHLARAFKVPCLTLFGPSHRALWHETDESNVALDAAEYCAEHRPPVTHIPAERVVDSLRRLVHSARRVVTK